jgi:magnesium chelatase subunit D
MRFEYPFSAIIGEDDLKLALQLVAVDPTIGGVLIRGERGTAKSTVARGLAALLPKGDSGEIAPFVELPLGATEDRVVGSLDVATALRDGRSQLRSGLLARADGGILYVDEVNLLPPHLVDLLLDSAARGWVTVERDGLSAGEAARFVLIGTMNPEEGELRPQFLDRFGLSAQVRGLASSELRTAAVARRLAFDADPARFVASAQAEEGRLRAAIADARARLQLLTVTDENLSLATHISMEHGLDGIRGDLAIVKTARALAAWQLGSRIEDGHIRRAADFAVPHRMRRRPDGRGGGAAGRARSASAAAGVSADVSRASTGAGASPDASRGRSAAAAAADASPAPSAAAGPPSDAPSALAQSHAVPHAGSINLSTATVDRDSSGRRGFGSAGSRRTSRAEPYDQTGTLAISETLTLAAARGARVQDASGVAVMPTDLMQHRRSGPSRTSVLFVVDASGSMAAQRRLDVAKGAALAMLRSSYQHRDEVALMVFGGAGSDLVLPFTSDVDRIESALRDVPTGGRTPLARALFDAAQLTCARSSSVLVLFTDGRANVAESAVAGADDSADPWLQALAAARALADQCSAALVVDCETGPVTLGRARLLAEALKGEWVSLQELESSDMTIRLRVDRSGSVRA